MGTNVAPILANIFVAMLENELLKTCKLDPKLQLPVLLNIFMDDAVGICYGTVEEQKQSTCCLKIIIYASF